MPENFDFENEEAREFMLNPANFEFDEDDEGFEDEFINDEGMIIVDENELHYGEHPVLPGQDPRGPPYIMLQMYDGAGPQQQHQFLVPERPGVFEFVARLIQNALPLVPEEVVPPKQYEFVLQPKETGGDWVCSICLDGDDENSDLKVLHPAECHTFHNTCLQRWLGRTPTCPVCRATVTPMLAREKR
jgi:Ring finger domain